MEDSSCRSGDWGVQVLRLSGGQVESLFDLGLPMEVRELPGDLAALDELLADPALLEPVVAAWEQTARGRARPTIPIERGHRGDRPRCHHGADDRSTTVCGTRGTINSTLIEADVRYPTDLGLAADATKTLARGRQGSSARGPRCASGSGSLTRRGATRAAPESDAGRADWAGQADGVAPDW
jgi:hypothetical protein